jgi:predicted dehydrogenase
MDEGRETMRVGAVGVGVHARNAILPTLPLAGLKLEATCARHRERAEETAALFGAGRAFDSVDRMLEEVELDGIVVVVPPDQFASVIRACMRHGIPVFTEKPAANDAAEAAELAREAEQLGVPVVVGYMKRFAGAYRRAKEIVEKPEFGHVTMGSFTWSMGPFSDRFSMRDWLFENPVHHFDLARFFFGELEDLHVLSREEGEYSVAILGRSSRGALVNIRVNTTGSWSQRNEAVEIHGEGHSVLVENMDTCIWRPSERPEHVWKPNYTVPVAENLTSATLGFGTELEHFRDVVVDGTPSASDMTSAAATLRLTSQIAERVLNR